MVKPFSMKENGIGGRVSRTVKPTFPGYYSHPFHPV